MPTNPVKAMNTSFRKSADPYGVCHSAEIVGRCDHAATRPVKASVVTHVIANVENALISSAAACPRPSIGTDSRERRPIVETTSSVPSQPPAAITCTASRRTCTAGLLTDVACPVSEKESASAIVPAAAIRQVARLPTLAKSAPAIAIVAAAPRSHPHPQIVL